MTNRSFFLPIDDPSRVAESRGIVALIAEREGMSAARGSNATIVVSELASNLLKHAQRGELQISPLSLRGDAGIEILSLDRGPGISDLDECFTDGHSTAGTAGTGLGAVRRLSDEFDVSSQPGRGTVIVSQVHANTRSFPSSNFNLGLASRPLFGETVSGDSWAIRFDGNAALILMADGLGHGLLAAAASGAAVDAFSRAIDPSPLNLVRTIHQALRGTRGAAIAVASVEFGERCVRFCGLGNIAGTVLSPSKSYSM